jgi:hypothetical protein
MNIHYWRLYVLNRNRDWVLRLIWICVRLKTGFNWFFALFSGYKYAVFRLNCQAIFIFCCFSGCGPRYSAGSIAEVVGDLLPIVMIFEFDFF